MLRLARLSSTLLVLSCSTDENTEGTRETNDTDVTAEDVCPSECAGLGELCVCTGGSDGEEKSWDAPLDTISEVLSSISEDSGKVAIWDGSYSDNLLLQTQSSVTLMGCGPDDEEVLLTAAAGSEALFLLTGVMVSGVSPGTTPALGRGIVVQATMSGMDVSACYDAGIFGLDVIYISVEWKPTIDGTAGDKKVTANDKVVISHRDTKTNPKLFFGQVLDSASTRAGIVLDGVNVVDLDSNPLTGNATCTHADRDKTSIVAQDGPLFQSTPSASYLEVVDAAEELTLNVGAATRHRRGLTPWP